MDKIVHEIITTLAVIGWSFLIYWIGKDHQEKTWLQVVLFCVWGIVGGAIYYYMDLGSDY
jgi:hypothetical protein